MKKIKSKMVKLISTLLFILCFPLSNIFSQSISGRVTDAVFSEPLTGATVKIEGIKLVNQDLQVGTYEFIFNASRLT